MFDALRRSVPHETCLPKHRAAFNRDRRESSRRIVPLDMYREGAQKRTPAAVKAAGAWSVDWRSAA